MFLPKRIFATSAYLISIIVTLVVAIQTKSTIGTLLCIFLQFLALTWYTLSYIPFARDLVKRMVGGCFGAK